MCGPVLIIEDDPDIAEGLRYGLESAQLMTRVAFTGEEGLLASLDREHPPALILLDLLLPGMSGAELCRRLRLEPSTRQTPIIIMSARVSAADIAFGLDVGADDYVAKPLSIKDLIGRIQTMLSTRQISTPD
jgi:DNA-binding response OmpR family regulator